MAKTKKKPVKIVKKKPTKKKLVKKVAVKKSLPKKIVKKKKSVVVTPVFVPSIPEEPISRMIMPPVEVEQSVPVSKVTSLSNNRTKLWAAVAVTMVVIVMAWVYALPYTIAVPADNTVQLSQSSDNDINTLVSDLKNSWNTLTQQAVNLNETTNKNLPTGQAGTAITPTLTNTNQAAPKNVPTNEELDQLFSDIN